MNGLSLDGKNSEKVIIQIHARVVGKGNIIASEGSLVVHLKTTLDKRKDNGNRKYVQCRPSGQRGKK